MAAADVISTMPTSFVYEDLVSQIQTIQNQMTEMENTLDNQWNTNTTVRNELKSRSFTLINPYGHRTVHKYMDHELINKVFKKYKKDYVPKYLHQWIKIGTMNGDIISPLSDSELKSIVSHYEDGYQFITYGEIKVWIEINGRFRPQSLIVQTLLSDDMNKIITQIKKHRQFDDAELKYYTMKENTKPDEKIWDQGTKLNLTDTISSRQLYEENCVFMMKLTDQKAS